MAIYTKDASDSEVAMPPDQPAVLAALVKNHRRFLGFLERRTGDIALAEEILQNAFVKVIERDQDFDSTDGAVTWFYRLLRNALTDHYRRTDSKERATARLAAAGETEPVDDELKSEICRCMDDLIPTLREEYAVMLREVDLKERSIKDVAADLGITANNATVRLYRGRQALKRQLELSCGTCADHGCLDCTCGKESGCRR